MLKHRSDNAPPSPFLVPHAMHRSDAARAAEQRKKDGLRVTGWALLARVGPEALLGPPPVKDQKAPKGKGAGEKGAGGAAAAPGGETNSLKEAALPDAFRHLVADVRARKVLDEFDAFSRSQVSLPSTFSSSLPLSPSLLPLSPPLFLLVFPPPPFSSGKVLDEFDAFARAQVGGRLPFSSPPFSSPLSLLPFSSSLVLHPPPCPSFSLRKVLGDFHAFSRAHFRHRPHLPACPPPPPAPLPLTCRVTCCVT